MTESKQLQSTENNNQGVVKMEPPPVSPSPSEQQYALKWNDFQTSILSSFRHLRDEEDFVDVTLACDQRSFTAHKVVLSACSPYFKKLLKANPCEHPIVILRDVRAEDVEGLLRFMYNGEVNIGHEQLTDFLKTAQLLQVRGLVDVTSSNVHHHHHQRTSNPLSTSTTINATVPSSTSSAVQELKASPVRRIKTSTSLPWELSDDRSNHLTPPPQKRIKSADLYRAQHGISPERLLIDRDLPPGQHPLTRERERNRDRDRSRDTSRDASLELRDSLLGQALESGQQMPSQKHSDLSSLQAQSMGEDSNSSDSEPSDRGDGPLDGTMDSMNGSMDNRSHSFQSALLGFQRIPGLLPGPSGIHGADNFVSRRAVEMRVRATDPRPCPKCGKIYRSAHTLRTHLEDKHTICPGYRCVLCGTVAKSRNSLHSHMSRQHRGISTKDLPVLPMPSKFDPELASRLLAKAGVNISAAELRARASPTSASGGGGSSRRSDSKLDLHGDDDLDDPEDLTMGGNNNNNSSMRYHDGLLGFGHPNTTITRIRSDSLTPKNLDSLTKDHGTLLPPTSTGTSQSLLDTYLQFITENTFGMQMSQEHAAAAIHAAKLAQLNAMGHNLDKIPSSLLPPHLDLSKISSQNNIDLPRLSQDSNGNGKNGNGNGNGNDNGGNGNKTGSTTESSKRHEDSLSPSSIRQSPSRQNSGTPSSNTGNNGPDIRRGDSSEPMDLGCDNSQSTNNKSENVNSDNEEGAYSDDEGKN